MTWRELLRILASAYGWSTSDWRAGWRFGSIFWRPSAHCSHLSFLVSGALEAKFSLAIRTSNLAPGTVKVWDEGIENNLQRKLINAPCIQSKDVKWIEVRTNFHRRNLTFCLGLHNCRPFCCTFFQYNLQGVSPSNALPCLAPKRILCMNILKRRYIFFIQPLFELL